jgi:hypothetical protein
MFTEQGRHRQFRKGDRIHLHHDGGITATVNNLNKVGANLYWRGRDSKRFVSGITPENFVEFAVTIALAADLKGVRVAEGTGAKISVEFF